MKILRKFKKGFTLVELVVVIAVIAILAAVSVGAYFGVTESANRSRLEQEAKQAYSNIQLVSLVDSNDSFDLDINGLHIDGDLSKFDEVLDNAGVDYELRDNYLSISQDKPTIIFSTESVQSQNVNKLYKQFDFYIPEISGMHANCDIINGGKIAVVKAENPSFEENETPDIEEPINPEPTPSVQFPQDTLVISAGDEGQLSATATPASDNSLIRYSSNNEDALIIDESTGEYLSDDSLTETTVVIVTVTTRENISDTIEITINPKDPVVRNFGLAYSKEQITDGSKIIIVHNTEKIAMGASEETYPEKMPAIANDLIGNHNISIVDGTLSYFTVNLSDDGSKFTLQAEDGRYLYRKGNSGTDMSLQSEQIFTNKSNENRYWFKVTFIENSFDVKIETLDDSNRFIHYNGTTFGLYSNSYSTRIYVENFEVSGQVTDFDYIVDPNKTEYEVGANFTISYKDGSAKPFFAETPTLSLSSENDAVAISGNKVTCNKIANDVEIRITAGEINKTFKFNIIEKSAVSESFKKVTFAPADWSGTYLIVCESEKVAFNGGLSKLDVASNTIPVTISNSTIVANETTKAAQFVITKSGSNYNIKSASGFFIGRDAASNGLNSNEATNYNNTISMSESVVSIKGKGGYELKFNTISDQKRFRYYKSGYQAITLYKLS